MFGRRDNRRCAGSTTLPRGSTALILAILILLAMVACAKPPDAPANQRYGYENTTIVVKWDASAGADSYTVYHSDDSLPECQPDSDRSSCQVLASDIYSLTYTHRSPGAGGNSYWVVACDSSRCSELDSEGPAQPPPPAPLHVRATQEGTLIRAVWNPVPEATYYKIYTGPAGECDIFGGCTALDENVVGTAYTHDSPSIFRPRPPSRIKVVDRTQDSLTVAWQPATRGPDLPYYWVAACNSAGCSRTAPTAPSEPSSTHQRPVQIDYYQMTRRSQESGHTLIDSRPVRPPYVDEDLQPNAIYYYTVQACNDGGCSEESDESGGLTESDGPVGAPSIPQVRGHKYEVSLGADTAGASWKSVEKATYYEVYQGSNFDEEVSAPGTSYRDYDPETFFGAFAGASYKVRACNKAGCSPFSETVTIR